MCRIKVLQVVTGLAPGGAERLVLDMLSRFDSTRFDVRLATVVDDLSALRVYGHPEQQVETFDLRKGDRFSNLIKMRRFLQSFVPDVIHAHMFHSLVAAVVVSRFMKQVPAICFTSHRNFYSAPRALTVRLLKRYRTADIVFNAQQHLKMNITATRVIPNGVQLPPNEPARPEWNLHNGVRMLAVGRLVEPKNPLGLLRSVVEADLKHWSLEFVGAGPLEYATRSLAIELGVSDRVNFLGFRNDVRQLMRKADIFVMHSTIEGMPMALLEAGAEAMPVIATPVGSIPEILADGRGVLAPPERYAQALRAMVDNSGAALATGRRLFGRIAEKHSIEHTVREHECLYQDLATGACFND